MSAQGPFSSSELLSEIKELQQSSKRARPWTIALALLMLAAFVFAVWIVLDSNRKIALERDKSALLQRRLSDAETQLANLSGHLRALEASGSLPSAAQIQVEAAVESARVTSTELEAASAAAQQNAAAIERIATGQRTTAGPALKTITVSSGRSNGWDIDIFWCANSRDAAAAQSNYDAANADAQLLRAVGTLSDGSPVGRIRVRPLPESLLGPYLVEAGSGRTIKPDRSPAEVSAARAIISAVGSGDGSYEIVNSGQQTRWYISMFVCR